MEACEERVGVWGPPAAALRRPHLHIPPPFFCVPSHGPGPLFLENRASTVAPLYVLAFCVPAPFLREAASPGPELRTEAEEVA